MKTIISFLCIGLISISLPLYSLDNNQPKNDGLQALVYLSTCDPSLFCPSDQDNVTQEDIATYTNLQATITNFLHQYNALVTLHDLNPTPQIEEYLTAADAVLEKITQDFAIPYLKDLTPNNSQLMPTNNQLMPNNECSNVPFTR